MIAESRLFFEVFFTVRIVILFLACNFGFSPTAQIISPKRAAPLPPSGPGANGGGGVPLDPNGRNGPGPQPAVCANSGRFLGAYCLTETDCRFRGVAENGAQTAASQQECIRAMCCTRSTTPNNQFNVPTRDDLARCDGGQRNGGVYFMGVQCRRSSDCNAIDPQLGARGYSLFRCVRGEFCCSKPFFRPTRRGNNCVNSGQFTGQNCRIDTDCQGNGGQRQSQICIQGNCCAVTSNGQGNDDYSDRTEYGEDDYYDDDDDDYGEKRLCQNGGFYLGSNCATHDQCGSVFSGRWTAVCDQGICCTNADNLGPDGDPPPNFDSTSDTWRRGQNACANFGAYIGLPCTRASDCGAHDLINFVCVSGFCCEEVTDYGPLQDGDRVCNYFGGRYLGYRCLHENDGAQVPRKRRQAQPPASPNQLAVGNNNVRGGFCRSTRNKFQQNVCLNDFCCAVDMRQPPGPLDTNHQMCTVYPYVVELAHRCTVAQDCPLRQSDSRVNCHLGVCCGSIEENLGNNFRDPIGKFLIRPTESVALCFDGTPSTRECVGNDDCNDGHSCVNHLCCPRRPDERQYVCGGIPTNGDCFPNSQCGNNLFCTANNLCCECRYGQPQRGVVDCRRGATENLAVRPARPFRPLSDPVSTTVCRPGYYCNAGGFCCPRCASGNQPYGSCYLGKCARGFRCRPGNICCEESDASLIN